MSQHVKGHFRNVEGKLVWVAEHEREGAPGKKVGLFEDWDAPAAPAPEPPAPAPKEAEAPKVSTPHKEDGVAGLAAGTDLGEGMAAPESKDDLTKQHFKDVGKKIGGAAKDMAALKAKYYKQKLAITLDDLESMESDSPELAQQLLTKEQQLGTKADFLKQMKAQGASPGAAYLAGRLYQAIDDPVDTPAGRKAFALGLNRVMEAVSTWHSLKDAGQGILALADEVKGFWLPADVAEKKQKLQEEYEAVKKAVYAGAKDGSISGNVWYGQVKGNTPEAQALADDYTAKHKVYFGYMKESQAIADADPANPRKNLLALGEGFKKLLATDSKLKDAVKKSIEIEQTVGWEFAEKKASEKGEDGKAKPKAKKPWHGWVKPESDTYEKVGGVPANKIYVAQTLKDTFGIKGIEYGNWMSQDASQHHTQACGEALADLSDILGISPEEVSLKGRLSLAFGARGKGKAKAHYELDKKAINLTKMAGGGSLAHEWGHALDNIMAMVSTGGSTHHMANISDADGKAPGDQLPDSVKAAFKAVHDAIHGGTFQLHVEKEITPEPGKTTTLNYSGKKALEKANGSAQNATDIYAQSISWLKNTNPKKYVTRVSKVARLFAEATGQTVVLKIPQGSPGSHFAATGNAMGEYWGRKHELFARAWESFISDKLDAKGTKNTYLVSGVSEAHAKAYAGVLDVLEPIGGMTSVYPRGEERQKINAAFEQLIGALKENKMYLKAISVLSKGLFE